MTDDAFDKFVALVRQRYDSLAEQGELFQVQKKDKLWRVYLQSFPAGTNPVYKARAEYDCQHCRRFVQNLGAVVSLKDGEVDTVWRVDDAPYPFNIVASACDAFVRSQAVAGVFRSRERHYGVAVSRSLSAQGQVLTWPHLHGEVFERHFSRAEGIAQGTAADAAAILGRGLEGLTVEALDAIIAIISEDPTAIYRGAEFIGSLRAFRALKHRYDALDTTCRARFVWEHVNSPVARFKNTVIGTLIQDISGGVEVDRAIKAFEAKVAPHNYQRPKALITKKMIEEAMKTIDDLGLRTSLERRHAKLSDVSVNDVLFVDRDVRPHMRDAMMDSLLKHVAPKPVDAEQLTTVSIADFMRDVVPRITSMEALVEDRHMKNLMSVTAPTHDDTPKLFQWDNDFSWSYYGNLADSDIKARVKAAGGNVTAPFRVSLAWFNGDDLDIHVHEPTGDHIYFGNKQGKLDVDMNAHTVVREPVENVCWQRPQDGVYRVVIHNYRRRESIDPGFELELECNGQVRRFHYPHTVGDKVHVPALIITLAQGEIASLEVGKDVLPKSAAREVWGVQSQAFCKVATVMRSPNHWHGKTQGNEHYFFILSGCANPDPVRCIYNEYLRRELQPHRKVFEVLGAKMMAPYAQEQLSGLGFSATQKDNVTIRVRGELNRLYNVQF